MTLKARRDDCSSPVAKSGETAAANPAYHLSWNSRRHFQQWYLPCWDGRWICGICGSKDSPG